MSQSQAQWTLTELAASASDGAERWKTVHFQTLKYSTPAPVKGSAYSSSELESEVRDLSLRVGAMSRICDATFLYFITSHGKELNATDTLYCPGSYLTKLDGPKVDQNEMQVFPSIRIGSTRCWSAALQGLPRSLKQTIFSPEGNVICQSVILPAGWQLQYFATTIELELQATRQSHWSSFWNKLTKRNHQFIDVANAAIFYAKNDQGFEPESASTRNEDLARLALSHQRFTLGSQKLDEILQGKYENPMLGIFGGHLYHRFKTLVELPYDLKDVVHNLVRLLGWDHPDVAALALAAEMKLPLNYRFTIPPMLTASWKIILEATAKRPELVPAESFIGRMADRFLEAGPWLVWEEKCSASNSPAKKTGTPSFDEKVELRRESIRVSLIDSLRKSGVTAFNLKAYIENPRNGLSLVRKQIENAMLQLIRASGLPRSVIEAKFNELLPETPGW